MPTSFTLNLSGNYKSTFAKHRAWGCAVIANGESWPRVVGGQVASSSDVYRLGLIPTYSLTAPTTTSSGTSSAGTFGVALVYRSNKFSDGVTTDDIQSNRSNIVDVTLTASDAAVLTKVTSSDTKVSALDIYAAQKIGAVYGTFYRVVKDGANTAGTITFNISIANGVVIGSGVTNGTADTGAIVLATDNDFPYAQPNIIEVAGRAVSFGGIVKRVTATVTNGSGTISTVETVYDGIEFWNFKLDSDTSGGIDGRGTYLCRYATSTTISLVDATGAATTYTGSNGSGTASIWTEPNRKYSKLLNPHAFPAENINNDYPSALLAGGKVPNTNRVLLMGNEFVIAEDYDRLPMDDGLNYVSTEYGSGSPFSVVSAHGRLYWLDLSKGKRELLMSDGSTVVPISTAKIKSILQRVTLDVNGDVWRMAFIHGAYYRNEDTIRWGLYLDNSTVANYILELDLNTGDLKSDPQFYAHRYLDVFTYGAIRGNNYIGQYGWSGGNVCRVGLDNVDQRYVDWAPGGTLAASLDTTGQTTTVFTVTGASFYTTGDGLKGIQAMVWRENDANGNLIANPTYYHCRISANTGTTITVNYVETMNAIGTVTAVGTDVGTAPSGSGWQIAIGVIQAMAGPKWFTVPDAEPTATFTELSLNHRAQALASTSSPIKVHGHENFDSTPLDVQYAEPAVQGTLPSDATKCASSFARPKINPVGIMGFTIVDNNVNTDTTALNIETITLNFEEAKQQGG